jgi:hypothetical protein
MCIYTHPPHLYILGLYRSVMERKQITIREDQVEWIDENHINLSSLVRGCIDERMESDSDD